MKSIGWRDSIAKQGGKILGRISKGILETFLERLFRETFQREKEFLAF